MLQNTQTQIKNNMQDLVNNANHSSALVASPIVKIPKLRALLFQMKLNPPYLQRFHRGKFGLSILALYRLGSLNTRSFLPCSTRAHIRRIFAIFYYRQNYRTLSSPMFVHSVANLACTSPTRSTAVTAIPSPLSCVYLAEIPCGRIFNHNLRRYFSCANLQENPLMCCCLPPT